MTDLDKAVELVPECIFELLDAILIEESPMHPFGCATWEEASRVAVDMAKDAIRDLIAALSAQSAELAKAREAIKDAVYLIDAYFMDDSYYADGKLSEVAAILDPVNTKEPSHD